MRVEIAPALLGVVDRQQDLRHCNIVRRQRFLIGVGQANLAAGGGGLFFLELERPRGKAEMAPANRDGARGHDHHFGAAGAQFRDIGGKPGKPRLMNGALRLVNQKSGAHLDDQTARGAEARSHEIPTSGSYSRFLVS